MSAAQPGDVAATSSVARDISAPKQYESARDEALVASRAKSEFLATLSHKIRTSLNGVVGLTELLLDTELTETQRDYAEGVRDSGEELLRLVDDIVDFAEMDAGQLDLE